MAKIILESKYTFAYTGDDNGNENGFTFNIHDVVFDTVTKAVESEYSQTWVIDDREIPSDYQVESPFHLECSGFTATRYYYQGNSQVTTTTRANDGECGYTPPVITDDLTLAETHTHPTTFGAANGTATLTVTTSNGPFRTKLNDGPFTTGKTFYEGLAAGTYTATAEDAAGFIEVITFTLVDPAVVPPANRSQIYFSRNPIWYSIPGLSSGQEIDLQLFAETEHYQADYQLVLTRRRTALANGSCAFELHDILHTLLRERAELPDPNQSQSQVCKQGILNYFVAYALVDPTTHNPGAFVTSDLFTVLQGGLPPEHFGVVDFFNIYLDRTQQFLTWSAVNKKVSRTQPEFLYYLLRLAGQTEVNITRKYTAADGTVTTATEVLPVAAGGNSLYRLLRLPVMPGNTATQVQIQLLTAANAPLSEMRTYQVEENLRDNDRFYLYENSIGGYDTMRTTGPAEYSLDGKDELADRLLVPGYDTRQGQSFVFSQQVDRKIKQSTGLHTETDHVELQEFIYAQRRFEVVKGRLLPIILGKRGYVFKKGEFKPVGYSFEYDYAFDSIAYANFR